MGWKDPDPLRKAAHDLHMKTAYEEMKRIEELVRTASSSPIRSPHEDEEYNKSYKIWRTLYNSCRNCGSDDVRVEGYDMMWQDGDIICNDCNCYVRGYDAG